MKNISPKEAYSLLIKGIPLIDVREKEEVDKVSCDVPHTFNISLSTFPHALTVITKDTEALLICHSGGRSHIAMQILESLGYANIKNIEGGILNWVNEYLPTKTSVS